MKLQHTLGSLVFFVAAGAAVISGCSRKDQSLPTPTADTGTKANPEALNRPATLGKPGTSAACTTCENTPTTCAAYSTCESLTGNAADGTPKSKLCQETLDCVRDGGCAADGKPPLKFCYCGSANLTDCGAGKADGPCKAVLERSLEGNTFVQIAQRIGNASFGGAVAMKRIDCDQVFCRKQCF